MATSVALICTAFTGPGLAPAAGGPTPPGAGTLEWSPCRNAAGFDCATAEAPQDHSTPQGRTVQLTVIKRKATGPGRRIGTLFFNPGGPAEREPRHCRCGRSCSPRNCGSASTSPLGPARCGREHRRALFRQCGGRPGLQGRIPVGFPVGEQERETWITAHAELGKRCEARDPELLRHVSTTDTAPDLDRLREAVGDRQLSCLGVSYGTSLGAVYANLFPDRVRAMVLDSNVDPASWVNDGSRSKPRLGTFLRGGVDLEASQRFAEGARSLRRTGSRGPVRGRFDRGRLSGVLHDACLKAPPLVCGMSQAFLSAQKMSTA
ncbi:alpha/beta fold hydrolase [Streptomyces sp. NPDC001970]